MSEIQNNYNTEACYSTEMKVKRPKRVAASAPLNMPSNNIFSEREADKKFAKINNDIYEGTKKEKTSHDFNRSVFFKIFGGVTLLTAGIAGIRKIRKHFGKRK